MIEDLKNSNPNKWYSKIKRMTSYDQNKSSPVTIEEIEEYDDEKQANLIADKFSAISQEYSPLDQNQIQIPLFDVSTVPVITTYQVKKAMKKLKSNSSTIAGDIPAKV